MNILDAPEDSSQASPEPTGGVDNASSGSVLVCACGTRYVKRRPTQRHCTKSCRNREWAKVYRPPLSQRNGQAPPPHSMRIRQDHTAIRDQILGLLMDGAWWTVWALAERCRCMETTASAKLRDLRKSGHGGFVIHGRRLQSSAAYEYRLDLAHPKREVE